MKVSIDLEVRSAAKLNIVGVHKYADDPTTSLLSVAWAVDDGPVKAEVVGDALPAELVALAADPSVVFSAFNAEFERVVWRAIVAGRGLASDIPIERWRCTKAQAAYHGLPRSLSAAAAFVGLELDKFSFGRALLRYLCVPVNKEKVRVANVGLCAAAKVECPAELETEIVHGHIFAKPGVLTGALLDYNARDVEVERKLSASMGPLPDIEQGIWRLDQVINDRGVLIDQELITAAMAMDELVSAKYQAHIEELANTRLKSPADFTRWLAQRGYDVPNIRRGTLEALLEEEDLDEITAGVISARISAGSLSRRKFKAAQATACADNRVRGMFGYFGASTGRWAGMRVQLHNMPRQELKLDPEDLADLVKSGIPELVELETGATAAAVLRETIRSMLIAAPGKIFVAADFSSIEARVLAWLAGSDRRVQMFLDGVDPYVAAAEQIFPDKKGKITKDSFERHVGKAAELALGYQGWVGAYRKLGGRKLHHLTDEEIADICGKWRTANPEICRLWRKLEYAAIAAATQQGKDVRVGRVAFRRVDGPTGLPWLECRLPSGRSIFYFRPTLRDKPYGAILSYQGFKPGAGSALMFWSDLYGGRLAENIVQAIARDVLAAALLRLEKTGYTVVAHVHDEIVAEVDENSELASHEKMCALMAQPEPWFDGLPIKAEGWVGKRYRK